MDGHHNSSPELPAPQPTPEKPDKSGESQHSSPEVGSAARQETPSQPSQAMPAMTNDDASQIAQPTSSMSVAPSDPVQADSHIAADEADVIEKQWVERAKDIVAKTRNDPRQQTRELNKFKAEYIQKRFGKNIKVADDAS